MAKHEAGTGNYEGRSVFQPVYSNQLLVDGTWYVTVQCPLCGMVDEEVPWADAKTPHHAGRTADERHVGCCHQLDEQLNREARGQEIAAARGEVARADRLLVEAEARHAAEAAAVQQERAARSALPPPQDAGERGRRAAHEHALDRRLAASAADLERFRRGPAEARRRLEETEAANGPKE